MLLLRKESDTEKINNRKAASGGGSYVSARRERKRKIMPEKKAYTLDFTQDEIILLYNVLGAYQNAIQTSTNCVLQTQLPELDDLVCGCENVRRKIFIESGLV